MLLRLLLMRRKIIRQGKSTLTLSLPAPWVRANQLRAGDEVDLAAQDQTLLVNAKPTDTQRTVTIDLRGIPTLHERLVAAAYLTGADEIKVTYDSPSISRRIQERVRDMIGMEIVAQDRETITIKDVTRGAAENFDAILRRVFYLVLEVGRETVTALTRKEKDLSYLHGMESNINRFTDYCQRILIKHGATPLRQTPLLYSVILGLEQLADEYKHITVLAGKHGAAAAALALLQRQVNLFAAFEKLYYAYRAENAANLAIIRDRLILDIDKKLASARSASDALFLTSIRELTELTIRLLGQTLSLQESLQAA